MNAKADSIKHARLAKTSDPFEGLNVSANCFLTAHALINSLLIKSFTRLSLLDSHPCSSEIRINLNFSASQWNCPCQNIFFGEK